MTTWHHVGMKHAPRGAYLLLGLLACGNDSALTDGEPTAQPHVVTNGTCAAHGELFTDHFSCDTVQGPAPTSESVEPASSKVTMPDPARLLKAVVARATTTPLCS